MTAVGEKVLEAFRIEHKEQIEGIRSFLAVAAEGEAAASGKVDEAFRLAHSFKGGARVCDLQELETLGHHLESLLARVRDGVLKLDQEARQALAGALDAIEDWMAVLPGGPSSEVRARVEAVAARLCGLCPPELEAAPEPAGAPARAPDSGAAPGGGSSPPADAPPADRATLRIRAEGLDKILSLTDELLAELGRQAGLRTGLDTFVAHSKELTDEWALIRHLAGSSLHQLASRPEFARVAEFLDFCDQQTQRLAAQARSVRLLHSRTSFASRSICGQLQKQVREARMVSVDSVFEGFGRMVRDVAAEEGKQVEFRTVGLDVQADKVVLQRLKDPVMHMLRNSVVHGIEPPGERDQGGKQRAGRVTLTTRVAGSRLNVRVADDGRGIDYEKVEAVARERGLSLPARQAAGSLSELHELLFQPGFSTRAEIDRLAGRGVGLSVVLEEVSRLQGEVRFVSLQGPGTAIEINVPVTMSTHRLLTAACAGVTVGIPVHAVDRVLRVRVEDMTKVEGHSAVLVGERPLPVCSLGQLLELNPSASAALRAPADAVVLRIQAARIVVLVDQFIDERDALVTELRGPAARIDRYLGGFILEDGGVGLVLNPAKLPDRAPASLPTTVEPPADQPATARPPAILIVDDSFTTRTLEKTIFESHGYSVKLAVDGVDALRQLRSEHVDLVVADVQMPRMDGFQLMEELKADPRLAKLPVVLVTSMDRSDHRERGLTLGAEAYIVKQKFDHEDLLQTVRQLIQPTGARPAGRDVLGGRTG